MNETFGFEEEEERKPRWKIGWWLPVVVGVVAFELTANPMLGVALGCVRFAERDFVTAFWIRRRDPIAERGRAVAWFHLAAGCCRTMVASLIAIGLTIALAGIIQGGLGRGLGDLVSQGLGASLTSLGAALGLILTAAIALKFALDAPGRVWIGKSNHVARKADIWPPIPRVEPLIPYNMINDLLGVAYLIFLLMCWCLAGFLIPAVRKNNQAAILIYAGAYVVFLLAGIYRLSRVFPRISARTATECWGEIPESRRSESFPSSAAR